MLKRALDLFMCLPTFTFNDSIRCSLFRFWARSQFRITFFSAMIYFVFHPCQFSIVSKAFICIVVSGNIVLCAKCFSPITQGKDTWTQTNDTNSVTRDGEEPVGTQTVASDGAGILSHHYSKWVDKISLKKGSVCLLLTVRILSVLHFFSRLQPLTCFWLRAFCSNRGRQRAFTVIDVGEGAFLDVTTRQSSGQRPIQQQWEQLFFSVASVWHFDVGRVIIRFLCRHTHYLLKIF